MVGQTAPPPPPPTFLPQAEHDPLPRKSQRVGRDNPDNDPMERSRTLDSRPAPRTESAVHLGAHGTRGTRVLGTTLSNSSLGSPSAVIGSDRKRGPPDARDVSAPGRSASDNGSIDQAAHDHDSAARRSYQQASATPATPTSTSRPSSRSDRHEHVQPPSYHEATERISIFIDGGAMRAVQGPSEGFSAGILQKIRAAQRDRDHYHPQGTLPDSSHSLPPQLSVPPAPAARRPLPPLPTTHRVENVGGPGGDHHRSSVALPLHRSAPDVANGSATPDNIPARSGSDTREGPRNRCDCNCTLEHDPHFRLSIIGPHTGYGDPSLLMHAYPPQLAAHTAVAAHHAVFSDPVEVHLQLAHRQRAYTLLHQARPSHRVGGVVPSQPPRSSQGAEESLHVDELDVGERKPLSRMEKALLRRIEFGPKVDYSILQLS